MTCRRNGRSNTGHSVYLSNNAALSNPSPQLPSLLSGKREFVAREFGAFECTSSRDCISRDVQGHRRPPNAGLSDSTGKSPHSLECVVADAVGFEPVSTAKFPANREINREFFNFWAKPQLRARHSSNDSVDLEQNSLLNRTGNFCEGTGSFERKNKEFEPGIFKLISG